MIFLSQMKQRRPASTKNRQDTEKIEAIEKGEHIMDAAIIVAIFLPIISLVLYRKNQKDKGDQK